MAKGNFIAYYRVSTDRQGRSGLGLEAQRQAVANYLNGGSWQLVAEYTEIESGKRSDRPELKKALAEARRLKAVLVIAKLDRLSRNVAFIANLMEAKVEFVAADFPTANRLTVHILAAVAEHEREMISERTKAALLAAKARGKRLGYANPRRNDAAINAVKGAAAMISKADAHAANVLPVVASIQRAGVTTLKGLAGALNARGIATARGGKWYASTVRNLVARAERIEDKAA